VSVGGLDAHVNMSRIRHKSLKSANPTLKTEFHVIYIKRKPRQEILQHFQTDLRVKKLDKAAKP